MITSLFQYLRALRDDEQGASLVEYGLLVALIALTVILTLQTIGTNLNALFQSVATALTT